MAAPAVNGPALRPAAWSLAPEVARDTQALVATGFGWLPEGRALLLDATGATRGWLDALLAAAPVTDAAPRPREERGARAAALAFTFCGLAATGLGEKELVTFALPFREGMFEVDRARRNGDRKWGRWEPTVVEDGPAWSGNQRIELGVPLRPFQVEPNDDSAEKRVPDTPLTVHALLLLYAGTNDDALAWAAAVGQALEPFGVRCVRDLDLEMNVEERDKATGISREHFSFADGLSQPLPFDATGAVRLGEAEVTERDPVNGVPLGEILLGFRNAHGEIPPSPAVADAAARAALPPHPEAEGFRDLGRHGTYVVVRELHQDVRKFWDSMAAGAARLRANDPSLGPEVDADWLAGRVVGRNRDGHVLCPGGTRAGLPPDGAPDSAFRFFDDDPHGLGCPLGSHIRRGNPRDGLAPGTGDRGTLLRAANNHRILRRARKYGPAWKEAPHDHERGLLFVCLNTDIARHFEFVQQTWLLNRDFAGLRDEQDPLVGPKGRFTIPAEPFRHALEVETFVRLAGGEYFFLPGLAALRHVAAVNRA